MSSDSTWPEMLAIGVRSSCETLTISSRRLLSALSARVRSRARPPPCPRLVRQRRDRADTEHQTGELSPGEREAIEQMERANDEQTHPATLKTSVSKNGYLEKRAIEAGDADAWTPPEDI